MKSKSKIKKGSKGNKGGRSRRGRISKAREEALVMLLAVCLLAGLTATAQAPQEWGAAAGETLDLNQPAAETVALLSMINLNAFYQDAATEVAALLTVSNFDPAIFVTMFTGITEFYRLASIQLEELLTVSGIPAFEPQVAGATLLNCSN